MITLRVLMDPKHAVVSSLTNLYQRLLTLLTNYLSQKDKHA